MAKTKHEEILYEFGIIKGEIKGIRNEMKTMNGTVRKNVLDIDDLQKDRNKLLGAFAVLSSIFIVIGGVIAKLIFGK